MCKSLLLLCSSLLLLVNLCGAQDDNQIVRFTFKFGFFEDDLTPLTEVIKQDVEGVLCQTQYFLSQLVQNATDTKSVHAKATDIDWGYFEGEDLPAHINFTVEFTDAMVEGDVNWIDDQVLIDEMEALGDAGLQKFVTDWVWKAEPKDLNFFTNANRLAFDGFKRTRIEGELAEAECPATDAPTMTPTASPAPSMITMAPSVPPPVTDDAATGADPNATDLTGGPVLPDIPGAGGNNGTVGNPSDSDWPFGENYGAEDDVQPMADFSLAFHMFENHEKPPTASEVNSLLCEVNNFFTQELRRKLANTTIHSRAVYVDWYFNEEGAGAKEDIIVNFTSFSYYADDTHSQIPAADVFEAMKLTTKELNILVEEFVWKSEPERENVFSHTEQVFVNGEVGQPLNTEAMMVEADGCILPPTGEDAADPNEDGSGTDGDAGAGGPPVNGSNPTDDNLGLGGDAKGSQVRVAFRVSNLEDIKDPTAIKAEGLDASFPVFSNEMVSEMTKRDAEARRILVNGRRLRVVAVPGTQEVTNVKEYPCPSNALPGATCHSASATYDVLMSSEEDESRVQNDYTDASQTAVDDGTYNNILQRVDPSTPLFIGIMTDEEQIPPGSRNRGYDGDDDDDGWFKWWYLLILLLVLLLCCLICLYCWMLPARDQPPKENVVYEREVLVEEFEDEGTDHGAPGDEDFVDDDGAGVQVPGQDPNTDAEQGSDAGSVVSYDTDQKSQDQAQRDQILSSSQRGEQSEEDNR